jgi:hypothetical protein
MQTNGNLIQMAAWWLNNMSGVPNKSLPVLRSNTAEGGQATPINNIASRQRDGAFPPSLPSSLCYDAASRYGVTSSSASRAYSPVGPFTGFTLFDPACLSSGR